VFGITGGGAQAEFVSVPEGGLAEIPANLDWAEAAAIPEVFMTAHDALFTQCELQNRRARVDSRGGVGRRTAASQLVHSAGAFAYGTSRTAAKLERAKEFGLTDQLPWPVIQYNLPRPSVMTNDSGVDVILDLVGGAYLKANLESLITRGRLIFVGTTGGAKAEIDYSAVMRKRLRIMERRCERARLKKRRSRPSCSHTCRALACQREVRPVIDSVFKIDEVRAAHLRLESNESFGKVVLDDGLSFASLRLLRNSP